MRFVKQLLKKKIKKYFYLKLPKGLLVLNFLVQRIFRINSECNFQTHYTSRILGAKNIRLGNFDEKVLLSFATSGGCYFNVFNGTLL